MTCNLKSIFFLFFIALSSPIYAQYSYSVSLGGSNEQLNGANGNHARLYLNLTENFRINTEFVRYYEVTEKSETEKVGYDYREINLLLNYAVLFGEKQKFGIYAALGFNHLYGRKGTEVDGVKTEKYNESGGMTIGFGTFYKMKRFMPYAESRNVSSGINNYLVFSAGLAYSFGKKSN